MKRQGLRPGMIAAVVVVVLLAVAISGDWLLLVPAALALAVAGVMARSPSMRERK